MVAMRIKVKTTIEVKALTKGSDPKEGLNKWLVLFPPLESSPVLPRRPQSPRTSPYLMKIPLLLQAGAAIRSQ